MTDKIKEIMENIPPYIKDSVSFWADYLANKGTENSEMLKVIRQHGVEPLFLGLGIREQEIYVVENGREEDFIKAMLNLKFHDYDVDCITVREQEKYYTSFTDINMTKEFIKLKNK